MSQAGPELLSPDAGGIARAVELLAGGGLVAVPTETVYGLAADATNGQAVARIFEAKGRPSFNPLIVHLPDAGAVATIADMPGEAARLAEAFWPGPLTLVLPLRSDAPLSLLVTSGLPTVAVRVPAHPVMQAVLQGLGRPVAAPSANPSGRISATTARHVVDGLGASVDAVLDAGPCEVGVESTILAPGADSLRLLREGGIPREAVEEIVGSVETDLTPGRIEAPGQMERHYAPGVPLIIGGAPRAGEVTVGFGQEHAAELTLSGTGNLKEAAACLFSVLHEADATARARGAPAIRVAEIPDIGLGRAINDRLRRAAVAEKGPDRSNE